MKDFPKETQKTEEKKPNKTACTVVKHRRKFVVERGQDAGGASFPKGEGGKVVVSSAKKRNKGGGPHSPNRWGIHFKKNLGTGRATQQPPLQQKNKKKCGKRRRGIGRQGKSHKKKEREAFEPGVRGPGETKERLHWAKGQDCYKTKIKLRQQKRRTNREVYHQGVVFRTNILEPTKTKKDWTGKGERRIGLFYQRVWEWKKI